MGLEEMRAELMGITSKIDEAGKVEDVKALVERAKELKADIAKAEEEARKEAEAKAEVRKSRFNPTEARKQMKGESKMENQEKRQAFRDYMMTREDTTTVLTDVVVPTAVTEAITKTNPTLGKILAKTMQTNYPAGVDIPIFEIAGTKAEWASENGAFETKKASESKVSFKAYKLGKIYGMSREVQVMSLPEFEQNVAQKVVADTIEAKEDGIFNGTGTGQMKGILTETGLVKKDLSADFGSLVDLMGALPVEYDANAEFYMNKSTFYKFVGMTDTAGQPIARVNTGLGAEQTPVLLGRPVNFTKYLPAYDTAPESTPVVVFGDMSKYVVNTIWENKVSTHEDFTTDRHLVKAVSIVDGKAVLPEAFVAGTKPALAKAKA